ncbi:MAG: tyrosine-type recombinase/integrase, partial [Bdellovibrionales bacterium]|nr:tyrosine-type recombinase/integrase [Bdellovibrionales bacterium]
EMLSLPRKGEYIFGDRPLNPRKAYEWVREAGKQAGLLKNLHPHSLRHSYATHLLSGGMDIRILQELLGHQSLSATQKYLHLGIDKLALTMEQHHPLGLPLNSSRESPDLLNEEVGRNESRTDKA